MRSSPEPTVQQVRPWKSALIGLAIGFGVVLATAPIGIYMAIGRDDSIKPGAIAIGVFWLVVLAVSTVAGAVTPRVLAGIDAKRAGPTGREETPQGYPQNEARSA